MGIKVKTFSHLLVMTIVIELKFTLKLYTNCIGDVKNTLTQYLLVDS